MRLNVKPHFRLMLVQVPLIVYALFLICTANHRLIVLVFETETEIKMKEIWVKKELWLTSLKKLKIQSIPSNTTSKIKSK